MARIKITDGAGGEVSSWAWIYKNVFESWLAPVNASLAMAITLVTFFGLILWWMFRKKIFIKI